MINSLWNILIVPNVILRHRSDTFSPLERYGRQNVNEDILDHNYYDFIWIANIEEKLKRRKIQGRNKEKKWWKAKYRGNMEGGLLRNK